MRYSQGETKLLEKICLGFAASTLYLLVQPVPDDIHKVQAQVSSPPPPSSAQSSHEANLNEYNTFSLHLDSLKSKYCHAYTFQYTFNLF